MDIVKQSLAITFVFALLWAALWFLRKRGNVRIGFPRAHAAHGVLESRGKLALGPQHSIHVVRFGEQDMVVAVHPAGVTLLRGPSRIPLANARGSEASIHRQEASSPGGLVLGQTKASRQPLAKHAVVKPSAGQNFGRPSYPTDAVGPGIV